MSNSPAENRPISLEDVMSLNAEYDFSQIPDIKTRVNFLRCSNTDKAALEEHYRERRVKAGPGQFAEKDSVVAARIANLGAAIPVSPELPDFCSSEDLISSRLFPPDLIWSKPILILLFTVRMRTSVSHAEALQILQSHTRDKKQAARWLKLACLYLHRNGNQYQLSNDGKIIVEILAIAERVQAVMTHRFSERVGRDKRVLKVIEEQERLDRLSR